MANTTKLSVGYLDFDSVKLSLRDFLRSQDTFKDYDFEGSGLSILLDVLSMNTHYFGFYMNMIANEMFLDSANLRSSVVSLAKMLNYTPRSITSAQAKVGVVITPSNGNTAAAAVIEKFTPFASRVEGATLNFLADRAYGATIDASGKFTFPDVNLIEGRAYTYKITVDNSIPNQRFLLPNSTIDTSTLSLRVQTSVSDTTLTTFILATNLLELKSDTKAYFLQEVENGQFEITFGDGVIGQALVDGNVVIVDYIISSGTVANGAISFSPSAPISGFGTQHIVTTTLVQAAGGLDAETTDQIRFAAPKSYQAQNRAVTVGDYKLLIAENYTNTDSVTVWGGEDAVPPQYGKVFISIKPVAGYVITETAKALVVSEIVRKFNIVSVIPEFVDPDYTFIIVNCLVKYNPSNTFKTDGDIRNATYNAIIGYSTLNLDKFDEELRYSKLLTAIDDSDPSITNNQTTIQMKKVFRPAFDVISNYTFHYNNPITPGTFSSTSFITVHDPLLLTPYSNGTTYTLTDDRQGNILMLQAGIGIPNSVVRKDAGTIDYTTGLVTLNQFMPFQGSPDGTISLIVSPAQNDVIPVRNNILFIQPQDISVVALPN
jgi:hypothetical protein